MPHGLKASWIVRAGLIPGEERPEFKRHWMYTGESYEKDQAIRAPDAHAVFSKMRAEAIDYYVQVSQPQLNNWAVIEFVWY